jgi:stress response protein YsnF
VTGREHIPGPDPTEPEDIVMTRSEEQLRVGTETVVVGQARLRKVVVTEQRTITVALRHEEYVLEREPLTTGVPLDPGEDPFPPLGSPDGTGVDGGVAVVLHAERPVITTEIVPVERIRLAVRTVTSEQSVTGPVRHEVVEYYAPPPADTTPLT